MGAISVRLVAGKQSTATLTLMPVAQAVDQDGDGVLDDIDNCPGRANPGQLDATEDGTGDDCGDLDASAADRRERDAAIRAAGATVAPAPAPWQRLAPTARSARPGSASTACAANRPAGTSVGPATCPTWAASAPPFQPASPIAGAAAPPRTTDTCGLDGTCNGAGACRRHPAGTVCRPAACALRRRAHAARHLRRQRHLRQRRLPSRAPPTPAPPASCVTSCQSAERLRSGDPVQQRFVRQEAAGGRPAPPAANASPPTASTASAARPATAAVPAARATWSGPLARAATCPPTPNRAPPAARPNPRPAAAAPASATAPAAASCIPAATPCGPRSCTAARRDPGPHLQRQRRLCPRRHPELRQLPVWRGRLRHQLQRRRRLRRRPVLRGRPLHPQAGPGRAPAPRPASACQVSARTASAVRPPAPRPAGAATPPAAVHGPDQRSGQQCHPGLFGAQALPDRRHLQLTVAGAPPGPSSSAFSRRMLWDMAMRRAGRLASFSVSTISRPSRSGRMHSTLVG